MKGSVVPIGFDGARVRLFPGFAWWRAISPLGGPGRNPDAENMLFDAARSIRSLDLVAGFWRDEADEMDWLEDFLCDPTMAEMIEVLLAPDDDREDEEPEIHYNRKDLAMFGSDVMDPN